MTSMWRLVGNKCHRFGNIYFCSMFNFFFLIIALSKKVQSVVIKLSLGVLWIYKEFDYSYPKTVNLCIFIIL